MPSEVILTIGWNVLSHVELEPAHCGDESCEADHGYLGTITADDLTLRVSEAADGEDAVRQVLTFASRPQRRHRAQRELMTLAREPRTSPIVPSYGESSLADLSASVLASLTGDAAANVLGLPEYRRVCLLLIDGLGLELLRAHQAAAPFLAELAFNSRPLTAGFPSTTVTSLASLGTGLPPAAHGMLGYQVAVPGEDRLLNGLHWPEDIDPVAWQPRPTIFERAAAAGVTPVHVAPGAFRKSGLTRAALRGAEYRPADSLGALAALTADALARVRARAGGRLPRRPRRDRAPVRGGLGRLGVPARARGQARGADRRGPALRRGHVRDGRPRHGGRRARRPDRRRRRRPRRCATAWRCSAARRGPGTCTPGRAPPTTCSPPGGRCSASAPGCCPREEAVKEGWFGPVGAAVSDAMARPHRRRGRRVRRHLGGGGLEGRAARVLAASACTAR